MALNIPQLNELDNCNNILIAGIGGGFDILCCLPLYFEFKRRGKTVHLANYSFTDFAQAKKCSDPVEEIPNMLLGAKPNIHTSIPYYPEGYLSHWFYHHIDDKNVTIWMFAKTGVVPLQESYAHLIKKLHIDGLLLVDGGVDSLMTGNEQGAGTLLEDSVSLAAVDNFKIPKVLACIGFGTEVEEQVCHYRVLQNMSRLITDHCKNFYGCCSLTRSNPEFMLYNSACDFVQGRPKVRISHISSRIVPAVKGVFGNYQDYEECDSEKLCLSILMGIYWFWQASGVIDRNILIESLKKTVTFIDVRIAYRQFLYERNTEMLSNQVMPY